MESYYEDLFSDIRPESFEGTCSMTEIRGFPDGDLARLTEDARQVFEPGALEDAVKPTQALTLEALKEAIQISMDNMIHIANVAERQVAAHQALRALKFRRVATYNGRNDGLITVYMHGIREPKRRPKMRHKSSFARRP